MIKFLDKESLDSKIVLEAHNLFKQLSPSKKQITLQELLSYQRNPLIFACYQEEDIVVGIASMCLYKVISGYKGWIEDVVVDINYRGKGIGEKLISALINKGKENGLTEIYLFTEDEKKAAIHLYSKLGFKQRDSKLYNLKFL